MRYLIRALEILKGALEDATNRVLHERGPSLSLPFLYFDTCDRVVKAVYDTSDQLKALIDQIERTFRESAAVRALINDEFIVALENHSSKDMPVVCVGSLKERAPAGLGITGSAVPPISLRDPFRASGQMQWRELLS